MNNKDNKTLRLVHLSQSYVIVAKRDGVDKYVSKSFPSLFQYTVKLDEAKHFKDFYKANDFIDSFSNGKCKIINPRVVTVEHRQKVDVAVSRTVVGGECE